MNHLKIYKKNHPNYKLQYKISDLYLYNEIIDAISNFYFNSTDC